jgi:Ribosomal protein L11 methyltransferase (PrmA)/Arginine methyltransferase oligomerization subdomain
MYSLGGYGSMIDDRVRLEAYAQALRKTVRPGSVVLEIGTGPGVFAVLACQLGASRVYAVEPDPIIQVAREIAAANGCADRIEFMEDLSTRITLPVQADVIVSDLRSVLPLFQTHLLSIADARRRFLAPGGTLIPKRDAIWVSLVECPEQYARLVDCWEENPLQQNLMAARRLAVNDFQKALFTPQQLLAPPQLWTTLDYGTVDGPDVQGTLNFSAQRAGTGHGLVVWFDTCLADGVGFSNAPGTPETVYGSAFFPWSEPVSLSEGQSVTVDLKATLRDGDYFWLWNTHMDAAGGATARRFEQSQLSGAVLSLAGLRRSASDYVPQLSEEGRLNRRTLDLMDGQSSLEEIARRLAAEFPERFTRWQQALSYAAKRSQEHSR